MKIAICNLKSISAYSQSRMLQSEKKDKELDKDYESRVWRERMHLDESGEVYIPPMAIKKSISSAARYLSEKIPGKGKATYTKHFESGILVPEGVRLGIPGLGVDGEWISVSSRGMKGPGAGTRVARCYPLIQSWKGTVEVIILDDIITEDIFEKVIRSAGQLIGVGMFRPENGGFKGRYSVASIEWKEA